MGLSVYPVGLRRCFYKIKPLRMTSDKIMRLLLVNKMHHGSKMIFTHSTVQLFV